MENLSPDTDSIQFLNNLDPTKIYDVEPYKGGFSIPGGAYTIEQVKGDFYTFTPKDGKLVYVNKRELVNSDLSTDSGMKEIGTHEDDFTNYYPYRLKDGKYLFNTVKGTFYKFSKSITGKTNFIKERIKQRRLEDPDVVYIPENKMGGIVLSYGTMITHLGGRRNRRRTKRARKHRRYSRRR
jgi:hypothetical protein